MKPASRHRQRGVSRRSFLLAAACGTVGATLSACGIPRGLGSLTPGGPRLSVLVIGFVGTDGQPFLEALRAAARLYVAAHRGPITLDIITTPAPPGSMYQCGGVACAPGSTGSLGLLDSTQPVVTTASGSLLAVDGRTALDMRFGNPPVPSAARHIPSPPDIIIAYDAWASWLGLFAADLTEFWKQASADRQGLNTATTLHGEIYCRGRGTVFAALPLLRSPMGLFCSRSVADAVMKPLAATPSWTWDALGSALRAAPFGIGAEAFSVNTYDGAVYVGARVTAAEATASFLSAYGGAVAAMPPGGATSAFTTAQALAALDAFVAVRSGGHLRPSQEASFVYPWIAPAYLWDPIGGGGLSAYVNTPNGVPSALQSAGVFYPWPAGPRRRAVPASYLCAYLWRGGPYEGQAADFCTFLLSSGAQRELARGGGGFALREADATKQLPSVGATVARPADAIHALDDLTFADLYGGWKTDQNAAAVDHIADSFEAMLVPLNQELPAPGNLPALVRNPSGV